MNSRLIRFGLLALVPVVFLGIWMPDKLLNRESGAQSKYLPHPGADIVAFVRDGCPHCADFHTFAAAAGWTVDYHEITTDVGAAQMYRALQDRSLALNQGVPTIVVDGRVFQGYDTDDTSGAALKRVYDACKNSAEGCRSFEDFMAATDEARVAVELAKDGTCAENCEEDERFKMNLWFIGEVDLLDFSLPGLAMLLGFLDGFNPCAMWVLITLLTLLINTHDWKKVWVIGGTFLLVSGAVYYMFIAAWLNVFLLIGLNAIVQIVIGLVAIGGGAFYLYEAIGKNPNECKVTNLTRRQKTIAKMKEVMNYTQWPAMIGGVAILAVSVNMIELVCTAGLPAVFTQILAINDVTNAARYGLIGLFILMYMIDDFIIFAVAVTTLHASGLTTKYRRFTLIFGGVLMYALGILLIFFPDALTFQAN